MTRNKILTTAICTGLMITGVFTVGRAAMKNPAMLFLAGQFKMMTGDNDSAMKLISRAARVRDAQQAPATVTKPSAGVHTCQLKSENPKKTSNQVQVAKAATPKMVLAKANSFVPPQLLAQLKKANVEVPTGLDEARFQREQMQRASEIQRRVAEQMVQLQRVAKVYRTHTPVPPDSFNMNVEVPQAQTLMQ